jgi:hypothetical protein
LYDAIAAGGMPRVHLGRLLGPVGFGRTVAIQRLYPRFAGDLHIVAMLVDEARPVARIRHPKDAVAPHHTLGCTCRHAARHGPGPVAVTRRERELVHPPGGARGSAAAPAAPLYPPPSTPQPRKGIDVYEHM